MAYTATRTTTGFELLYNLMNQPDLGVPRELTPSLAVVKGDMLVLTLNKVAKAAAGAVNVLGVAAESKTAHATTKTTVLVHENPANVYRCTFSDHLDSTATGAGSTTTLVDTALADTANAYVGGTLYIYDGAGKGEVRTISAYNGTTTLTFIEPLYEATGATSKYILIGAAVANEGIADGTIGVDLKDENTIDADATILSEAGPLAVKKVYPVDLMMDVMIRKHRFDV
uniref:Putative tail protein n=1 Tax=viral metagenome TaxID=1070528 RepID=A0A6M3IHD9_9ZZZZ